MELYHLNFMIRVKVRWISFVFNLDLASVISMITSYLYGVSLYMALNHENYAN